MSRVISQDLQASGVAQVIVVLKQPPGAPARAQERQPGHRPVACDAAAVRGLPCRASSATSATPS